MEGRQVGGLDPTGGTRRVLEVQQHRGTLPVGRIHGRAVKEGGGKFHGFSALGGRDFHHGAIPGDVVFIADVAGLVG